MHVWAQRTAARSPGSEVPRSASSGLRRQPHLGRGHLDAALDEQEAAPELVDCSWAVWAGGCGAVWAARHGTGAGPLPLWRTACPRAAGSGSALTREDGHEGGDHVDCRTGRAGRGEGGAEEGSARTTLAAWEARGPRSPTPQHGHQCAVLPGRRPPAPMMTVLRSEADLPLPRELKMTGTSAGQRWRGQGEAGSMDQLGFCARTPGSSSGGACTGLACMPAHRRLRCPLQASRERHVWQQGLTEHDRCEEQCVGGKRGAGGGS